MPRSFWIDGSATSTTVLSNMIMKRPTATAASVHHLRSPKRRAVRSSTLGRQRFSVARGCLIAMPASPTFQDIRATARSRDPTSGPTMGGVEPWREQLFDHAPQPGGVGVVVVRVGDAPCAALVDDADDHSRPSICGIGKAVESATAPKAAPASTDSTHMVRVSFHASGGNASPFA
jgi:hypothetical protein